MSRKTCVCPPSTKLSSLEEGKEEEGAGAGGGGEVAGQKGTVARRWLLPQKCPGASGQEATALGGAAG